MREKFREYHQFTPEGYSELLSSGIFVLDTNTLLNMYRYSRSTVDNYIKVLKKLKKTDQIWMPYQVGLEFHENRVNVISDHEKSYDDISSILNKAKRDLDEKYRDHPFLNMAELRDEVSKSLSNVEDKIKAAKKQHPKWLEKDDVLAKIADLYDGCTGDNYSSENLEKMYQEGKERYALKIPPGFRDADKPDNRKYGDLIVWKQMIDKARQSKKPIIFISGDVKDDWWLKKDKKRIMPLPKLKKEMLDKADVDFHIYTADKFLELFQKGDSDIEENTIKEVRKVLEVEEQKRLLLNKLQKSSYDADKHKYYNIKYKFNFNEELTSEYDDVFRQLNYLKNLLDSSNISSKFLETPELLFEKIELIKSEAETQGGRRVLTRKLARHLHELSASIKIIITKAKPSPELRARLNTHSARLEMHSESLIRNLDFLREE